MNITYQYLQYFSFNSCNFKFTHIYTSSHTYIISFIISRHIPTTKFTVNRQAQKYWSRNKYQKKKEPGTKKLFSLGVFDHSNIGNSTFFIRQFCYRLVTATF